MKREKKISFKYSLYKTKKPSTNLDGEEIFPVYVKIIFNSHSTKFLLQRFDEINTENPPIREITLEEGNLQNYTIGNFTEKYFEKIVRHEFALIGESYSLSGLNSRLSYYGMNVAKIIDKVMNFSLTYYLGEHFKYNDMIRYLEEKDKGYNVHNERKLLSNTVSFFSSYHYFQSERSSFNVKTFQLVDILPDKFKVEIVSFIKFLLFVSKNRHLCLIDWVKEGGAIVQFIAYLNSDKYHSDLKEFILRHSFLKPFLKEYKNEFMALSVQNTVNCVDSLVQVSPEHRSLTRQIIELQTTD